MWKAAWKEEEERIRRMGFKVLKLLGLPYWSRQKFEGIPCDKWKIFWSCGEIQKESLGPCQEDCWWASPPSWNEEV